MHAFRQRLAVLIVTSSLIAGFSGAVGQPASAAKSHAPVSSSSSSQQKAVANQLQTVVTGKRASTASPTPGSARTKASTANKSARVAAASAPSELIGSSLTFDTSTIEVTANFNVHVDPRTDPRFTSGQYVLGMALSFNHSEASDATLIVGLDDNDEVSTFGLNKWGGYCPAEMVVASKSITIKTDASCFYRPGSIAYTVIYGDLAQATASDNWQNVDVSPPAGISDWQTKPGGYWMLGADGGVFSYGGAQFFGSTGNMRLNKPVVGMSAMPKGNGYRFVAADGGVFNFGEAGFYGSTGNMGLNQPVVGMASTKSGNGYWLVASDGGIFTFGDAEFYGSMGDKKLNQPIVAMAATPNGDGYYLVAADGGIFTFGDAEFLGSAGGSHHGAKFTSMTLTDDAKGYYLLDEAGAVSNFGEAPELGEATDMWGGRASAIISTSGGYRIFDTTGAAWQFGTVYHHGDMIDQDIWPAFPIIGAAEVP